MGEEREKGRGVVRYFFERLLLRGTHYRLLLAALTIVVVAVVGGLLALWSQPDEPTKSIWWAFLRLTDPGYLGDDEGLWRRFVSTLLTVAGYVLFMGALVAIMTQWLDSTIKRMQRGESRLAIKDHLLVLRLTDRTPVIIDQLLLAEDRVERFLARVGRSTKVRIVVLVEDLDADVAASLRDELREVWDDRIILRSGSCLVRDHLERVNALEAAAILIPSGKHGPSKARTEDAETVKAVLSIAAHPDLRSIERPPRILAEIHDSRLTDVVQASYPGVLELVPNHTIVSRLMVHNLRHRGLSVVLGELLAKMVGNDLFFIEPDALAGRTFGESSLCFQSAVLVGFVRKIEDDWEPHLAPKTDEIILESDRLVVVARSRSAAEPSASGPSVEPVGELLPPVVERWPEKRRILILGWSTKVAPILRELDSYGKEDFTVEVMGLNAVEERIRVLEELDVGELRFPVTHRVGDFTRANHIRAVRPETFDNVLLLGRDWTEETETSDAQVILGYHVLLSVLRDQPRRPGILVELTDPANTGLFAEHPGEVVLSPTTMAHILAHMALHPSLGVVLEELFTVGGAEIHFRPLSELGLEPGSMRFLAIREAAQRYGEVALGVRLVDDELARAENILINPAPDEDLELGEEASILVLTHY